MSRLAKNGHSITKERQRKFFDWRKDEPMLVEHPVRWAATQAMRDENRWIVSAILAKPMKRVYASVSKPDLLRGLENMTRSMGLTPKYFLTGLGRAR
jgi:hypothetical protein